MRYELTDNEWTAISDRPSLQGVQATKQSSILKSLDCFEPHQSQFIAL